MNEHNTEWRTWMILMVATSLIPMGCGNDGGSGGGGDQGDTSGPVDGGEADAGPADTHDAGVTDAGEAQDAAKGADSAGGTSDSGAPGTDGGSDEDAGAQGPDADSADVAGQGGCKKGDFVDPTDKQCKAATCKAMTEALYGSLKALVNAHNDCTEDVDCVMAQTGTACQGTCGAPIHKDEVAAFETQLGAIDQAVCVATGFAGKCGYSTPACAQPKPGCEAGKCVYNKVTSLGCKGPQPAHTVCKDGEWVCKEGTMHLPGSNACVEPTCKAVSSALKSELGEALAAGGKCKQHSDCTTVSVSHACWGACPAAISTAAKAGIETLIQAHDGICKMADYAKKCGYMTPKCVAPDPGCEGGVCVYKKGAGSTCAGPQPPFSVCEGGKWVCAKQTFKPYGSELCVQATCANKGKYKGEAIAAAVKAAQKCVADSDCTVVGTGTKCGGTCGAAVNKANAADVAKVVSWVDTNICKVDGPDSPCPYMTPGCVPPKPGCSNGLCVYFKP